MKLLSPSDWHLDGFQEITIKLFEKNLLISKATVSMEGWFLKVNFQLNYHQIDKLIGESEEQGCTQKSPELK